MEVLLMGSIVFFTAFTLISYLLIILNLTFLIIPISLIAAWLAFKFLPKTLKKIKIGLNWHTFLIATVFVVGILGQMAVIAPSGIKNQSGDILFWSAHGHDGPWHIALMEEMKKAMPAGRQDLSLENPVYAGEKLVNYHFFSDVAPAIVSKYLPISNFDLYFRIFPLIYSIFLGVSAYFLTKKLTKDPPNGEASKNAPIWAVFFTYFAGSFGYLIQKGESVFWATQPQSSSGNPPQIISDFLFLSAIYFVISFMKEKNKLSKKYYFLANILILGSISAFKIYAGVVILLSVGIVALWRFIKNKKIDLLIVTFISGVIALALYLPNSSNSTSFLIFEPWWYIRTMIVEPSRLNLLDWELRRQTYIYEHNWKRVVWLEGLGFLIFFFGNLGMRFLGLLEFLKTHAIIKWSIIISLVLPLLFLQKGVASNTSQFLQYFLLLFGVLSGIAVSKLTKKFKILIPVIVLLAIPTQINLLKDFYSRPAFAKISGDEVNALQFIKNNSNEDDVILTPPYDENLNTGEVTPPIWDWFDTAYVSALSSRRTYFDDYEQIDIMGYDKETRYKIKKEIFETKNLEKFRGLFNSTKANILYFPKMLRPNTDLEKAGLTKIFDNQSIEVWKAK